MLTIFGDFETFYSRDYSLRKMTAIQYIKDYRFQSIGCAVCIGDKDPVWLEGDNVAKLLRKVTQPYMFVSHNSLFDACILSYRYQIYPDLCVDTLGMSRALLMPYLDNGRATLENIAKHLHLPPKGLELNASLDKTLEDFKNDPVGYKRFQEYCKHDAWLCREIYRHLSPKFPASEHIINDMIVRAATTPQFTVDYQKLLEHKTQVVATKTLLLAAVEANGSGREDMMSNDKFAARLMNLGVNPPRKTSVATGKQAWAFAKADQEFMDLQEHENPEVQSLMAARLGLKSTLEETRTQRFLDIATVTYDGKNSWMPIPLRYGAAHTHRFGGEWKLNMQNLPARKVKTLRESLTAPEGFSVVTVDASQIEARLVAWLAKELELVELFAQGVSVYAAFASDIYGYPVSKKLNPFEYFLGKKSILGLGFGMGDEKFYNTVLAALSEEGMELDFPRSEAQRVVRLYRTKYKNIRQSWGVLNNTIPRMYRGDVKGMTFGPCKFEDNTILLPNGMRLVYHKLAFDNEQWSYQYGRERKFLYGGKMLENIVQALDRVVVMEAAIRIRKQSKKLFGWTLHMAMQVHDELVYIVPNEIVAETKNLLLDEMRRRPAWALDLPLDAETGSGSNFGDAK